MKLYLNNKVNILLQNVNVNHTDYLSLDKYFTHNILYINIIL